MVGAGGPCDGEPVVDAEVTREVVTQFLRHVRSGREPDRAAEFMAPVVLAHQVRAEGAATIERTPAEYAGHVRDMVATWGEFTLTVDEFLVDGARAFVRLTQHGHHRATVDGHPPTGRPVREITAVVYHVEGGVITQYWMQIDRAGLAAQLTEPAPATPAASAPAVRLAPMTEQEYGAYRATSAEEYATQIADAGAMSLAEARQKAADDAARLLPDGLATPGSHLWTAYDGDQAVGVLWLHVESRTAAVYDIVVRPGLRRRGYGRAIMRAAERESRARGAVLLRLNVFGHNAAARNLYDSLGFQVTSVQLHKRL